MSNVLDAQVLYLEMDEIRIVGDVSVVEDDSGNDLDGTVIGDARVIADSLFGATVFFDGDADYVDVDIGAGGLGGALNGSAFTLTAWLKPRQLKSTGSTNGVPNVFFAQTSSDAGDNLRIGVDTEGKLRLYLGLGDGDHDLDFGDGHLTPGSWHFVALVFNAGDVMVHLDDDVFAASTGTAAMSSVAGPHLTVGGATESAVCFNGALHDVRVFDSALTEDAVRAIKSVDLTTAATPSRQSVLIDFAVEDSHGQPTLYIVDENSDETTTLTVENTASRTLSVPAVDAAELDSATAPFWLQFRPGVLDDSCYADESTGAGGIDVETDGWNWSLERLSDGSGLLLLAPREAAILAVGGRFAFSIRRLTAAAAGGARGTRAMLGFQHVGFPADDGSADVTAAAVSGYRQVYLHIANQSGKRTTPLVMGFVGSNAIINDGESENSFVLSIINPSSNDVSLSTDPDAPTRFVFGVPVGNDAEDVAALCLRRETESISVDDQDGGWEIESSSQTLSAQWVCMAVGVDRIPANGHIEFAFTGLVTSTASGRTLIAMHYQNLPGYWDGYLTAAIEKAPVRYSGTRVGIGIAEPGQTLHVRGNDSGGDGIALENRGKGDARLLFLNDGMEQFGVALRKDPNDLTGDHAGLAFHDYVAGQSRLTIDASGNVGIGKSPDGFMLDVKGDFRVRSGGDHGRIWSGYERYNVGLYLYDMDDACVIRFRNDPEQNTETGDRYKDGGAFEALLAGRYGNIGIGTLDPRSALDVKGDLALSGAAKIAGELNAGNAVNVGGELGVTGAVNLGDVLKVAGAANVGGKLDVAGAATLASLMVGGNLDLSGLLGTLVVNQTGTATAWRIGTMTLQWGVGTSSSDDAQTFKFAVEFGFMCYFVIMSRIASNSKNSLHPSGWDRTSFKVNRSDDGFDGDQKFAWFAIGL